MDDYVNECEKCLLAQENLLKALNECSNREKIDFVAFSQNESQSSQNILVEKHYLNKAVVGPTDDCFYNFKVTKSEPNRIFCIKHGSIELLKSYEVNKKQQEELEVKAAFNDYIWIGVGLVIFVYFVFLDKGRLL